MAHEEKDGIDILNIDTGKHDSEPLHNFTLESNDRSEEVSFRMKVTFKYENGVRDVKNEFVRTFGRSRQLEDINPKARDTNTLQKGRTI